MIFRKKNKTDVQKLIDVEGIDIVAGGFAAVVSEKLPSYEIALQFVLEELEAASNGSSVAKKFVMSSGFSPSDYRGALNRSIPEVDGPGGPQQMVIAICSQLMAQPEIMVELRLRILDRIMREYAIGRYSVNEEGGRGCGVELEGGMRIEESGVDVLFVVKNDHVLYTNCHADHLFIQDSDGDKVLDGSISRFVFFGQSGGDTIEVFVAFDEQDSYSMFTVGVDRDQRLVYVCQSVFKYLAGRLRGLFSAVENYSTEFEYTFRLYERNDVFYMVNRSRTQGYLVDGEALRRDEVDVLADIFNEVEQDYPKDDFEDLPIEDDYLVEDNNRWIDELIAWADAKEIPDRTELSQSADLLDPANIIYMTSSPGFPRDEVVLGRLGAISHYHEYRDYKLAINLNGVSVEYLPDCFFKLAGLHVLYLHTCGLSSLSEKIVDLCFLVDLDLGCNSLQRLPDGLGGLKYLKKLSLSNNDLVELPEDIVELRGLESLNIAGNSRLTLSERQYHWMKEFESNGGDLRI